MYEIQPNCVIRGIDPSRYRTAIVLLLTALLIGILLGLGAGSASASYDGNVTISDDAKQNADFAIVPTDKGIEEEDDIIAVTITAQDIGDTEDITGFKDLEIQWDPTILDLQTVEPNARGAIRATDEDFEVNTGVPGYMEVEWWPSGFDAVVDELAPIIEDDVDQVWPQFDDDRLITLIFEPGPQAEVGDVTEVEVGEDATITSGFTELFSSEDNDNIFYGSGEVEVVPESLEPSVDDATGSFTAESTGGYVSFGEDSDPGPDEAVAEFDFDDREIIVEGDYNESGVWRADPNDNDIVFPDGIPTRTDSGAEVDTILDEPWEGEIDTENNTMTMDTDIGVFVPTTDDDFFWETSMTSDESGELEGNADFDVDDETLAGDGDVRIVDNEFIVTDEENPGGLVEDEVNLDEADEAGMNYLVLEFDMTFEEFTGEASTLDATVENSDGEPIDPANIDIVDDDTQEGVTDGDGELELEGIDPGEQEVRIEAEGYLPKDTVVDFEALETEEKTFELQEGTANVEVDLSVSEQVSEGDEEVVRAEVENVGDGIAEQEIELTAGDETLLSEEVTLGTDIDNDDVNELDTSETFDIEWTPDEIETVNVQLESEDDAEFETVEVVDADDIDIDGLLTGESVEDSLINFDEPDRSGKDEGLLLPPGGDELEEGTIELDGDVMGDTWESTSVDFPDLNVEDEFVAEVDAPLDLEGTFDTDEELMTVEGTLEVTVFENADGERGDELASFNFEIEATTESSGELEGDASFDDEEIEITAVDNEYTVPTETGTALDDALGLPVEDEGLNWLVLNFELDLNEDVEDIERGDVAVTVVDEDGDEVSDADVELEEYGSSSETDDEGLAEFDGIDAGEDELAVSASGFEDATESIEIEDSETTEVEVELEAGDPEFDVNVIGDSVAEGETAEVTVTVSNEGTGSGEQDIDISIGDEVSTTETAELDADESETFEVTFDTESGDQGTYTAEAESDDDEDTDDVEVREELGAGASVEAGLSVEVDSGFISFDEDNEDEAIEEGLGFPDNFEDGDSTIEIEGAVFDTGEWVATEVEFPELNTEEDGDGLTAAVDPDGLGGEIDTESGEMTTEGDLTVTVMPEDDDPPAFTFGFDAVADESGELSGDADLDEDGGSVTLVDNDFAIPTESGDGLVDSTLGLPVEDPELNWLELASDVELDQDADEDDFDDLDVDGGAEYDSEFEAEIDGGFISFDEDNFDDAVEEGLGFPENFEDEDALIEIEGLIIGDQWEATDVEFPELNTEEDGDGLTAAVDPDGLRGTIDTESGEMTTEGDLTVTVMPEDDDPPAFTFGFDAISDESGELSGDADLDEDGGSVTLVDNAFAIPTESGDGLVDSTLGLPVEDPELNWLELELEMDIEELEEPVEAPEDDESEDEDDDESEADDDDESEADDDESEADDEDGAEIGIDVATETTDEGVEVTATVENNGDESSTEEVEIEADDEVYTEEVTVEPGESAAVTASFESDDPAEASVSAEAGGVSAAAAGDEGEDEPADGEDMTTISLTGDSGFISFAEDNFDDAVEEGLDFPDNFEEEDEFIQIDGQIENGEWVAEGASFPTLNTEEDGDGISADVEVPDGFSGEIDRDSGEMTIDGGFEVIIDGDSFEFEVEGTTGTSGELEGEPLDDPDSGTVTLVDNEYLVEDETGNSLVDNTLDLPVETEGENWLEVEFDVEIEEFEGGVPEGTLTGAVEDEDGNPIEDASVTAGTTDVSLDDEGTFEETLEADDYDITVEADGFEDEELSVTIEEDETEDVGTITLEEAEEEEPGTFLTAFGQLVGFVGLLAGVLAMGLGVASRFITAIDPDS